MSVNKIITTVAMTMITLKASCKAIFNIFFAASIIKTITAPFIPVKIDDTVEDDEILVKNVAITEMIINDGSITPKVAQIAPNLPATLYPTSVEVLMAIAPGNDCDTAKIVKDIFFFYPTLVINNFFFN